MLFLAILPLASTDLLALCLPLVEDEIDFNISMIQRLEEVASKSRSQLTQLLGEKKELVILFQASSTRVNAEVRLTQGEVILELFGGMLVHPRMSPEAFQLLLCHELGHVLGGPPYKSRNGWSSTEGQADYYSGQTCARYLGLDETGLIEGALALTSIYSEVMRHPAPRLEACEETQVERTNYGYPTAQCRLQTILAGWREDPRPRCWYRD